MHKVRATIIAFEGVAQDRCTDRCKARRHTRLWLGALVSVLALTAGDAMGDARPPVEYTGWKSLGEFDGVALYTRPFADSALPEVRATATVCSTLPQLVAWVEDVVRFDRWIPDTEQARLLSRPSPQVQIYYIRTSMPWPVRHRDMIYRLTELPASDPRRVSVAMEGLPDYLPAYPGVTRMISVTGMWTLREAAGVTHIRLDLHIEPGGSIPAWLARRRLVATPRKMLGNLASEFASGCHAAAAPGK